MAREIRYDPDEVAFRIGDDITVSISRDDAVIVPREAVVDVTVASFESALTEYEDADAATTAAVFLSNVATDAFDPDSSTRDIWLSFLGEELWGAVIVGADEEFDTAALLAPLIARHAAEHSGSYRDDQEGRVFDVHSVRVVGDGRTLGELADLVTEAQALVDAVSGMGELDARVVRNLVAAGSVSVLMGQPESRWIDAKGEQWRLDTPAAALEIAKDVAAFANTGIDAILVYGVATAQGPGGGDVLDKTRSFELAKADVPALESALADRLVPLITDLNIGVVELRQGSGFGIGWIFIPAQPAFVRPVLVRGAIAGGKVHGSHVSVPFRVGEHTRHWDASTLHSLIQAGRVALMRAEYPDVGDQEGPPPDDA